MRFRGCFVSTLASFFLFLTISVTGIFQSNVTHAGPLEDLVEAQALFQQGDFEESLRLVNEAIESGELTGLYLSSAFSTRGSIWRNNGKFEKAIDDYTNAIESGGLAGNRLGSTFYLRGISLDALDRYEEAAADFSSALEIDEIDQVVRATTLSYRAFAYYMLDKPEDALKDYKTALSIADFQTAHYGLLHVSDYLERYDLTLKSLLALAQNYPQIIDLVEARTIWHVIDWAKEEGKDDELFELLSSLIEVKYTGPNLEYTTDRFLQELAFLYLKRDDAGRARELVDQLTDTFIITNILIDRRFEDIWDLSSLQPSSLQAFANQNIELARGLLENNPSGSGLARKYANSLRMAGKSSEAIDFLNTILEHPQQNFTDKEIVWLKAELAKGYRDTGQKEKAYGLFDEIVAVPLEVDPALVTQYLAYAEEALYFGDFEKALERSEFITSDSASDFGMIYKNMIQACALYELGNIDKANSLVDRMLLNWEVFPAAVQVSQICLKRYDEAAEMIIKRLRSKTEREDVLLAFQNFQTSENTPSYIRELYKRYEKIKENPKVVAEFNKYGRIITLPFLEIFWRGF